MRTFLFLFELLLNTGGKSGDIGGEYPTEIGLLFSLELLLLEEHVRR